MIKLPSPSAGLKALRTRTDADAENLLVSIRLEETPPPVTARRLIFALAGLLLLVFIWAGLTQVEEVARAPGAIAPDGDVVAVQHLEGGLVEDILVRDGERVEAGQVLVRLSPAPVQSELDQLVARRDQLQLSLWRERSIEGRRAQTMESDVDALQAREQVALLDAQSDSNTRQMAVFESRIAEIETRIATLTRRLDTAREAQRIAVEERDVQESLMERGIATRDRVYAARQRALDATAEVERLESDIAIAQNQQRVAENERNEFEAGIRTGALESSSDIVAELARVEASIGEARDRLARLAVRAPVTGVVSALSLRATNSVIGPGESILEIVPTETPLVVSAQLHPRDAGRIRVGQAASVRVAAFDHATYGALPGEVSRISATTFQTEAGQPFYRVWIALSRDYYGPEERPVRVSPGMTVEADIKNGTRSILTYLLKPVSRGWDNAFRER